MIDPRRAVPALTWIPRYRRADLPGDLLAGIVVAALAVTEAVAYSGIIGVPATVGLAAVPFCLVAYALLGSSPLLVVGPLATMAVISGSVVADHAHGRTGHAVTLTCALAIATGLVLLVAAVLRLGWVSELLSRPILAGFISGLVVLIVVGELPDLLGIAPVKGTTVEKAWRIAHEVGSTHALTAAVGAAALVVLIAGRRLAPRLPWGFVVLVGSIAVSATTHLARHGVAVVGTITGGLPRPTLPSLAAGDVGAVLLGGVALALVGLAESLSVARRFALRDDVRIRTNQEFVAQGVGNVVAGLFGGFATCGSLVKTAAADRARGRTQVVGLVAAALGLAVLLGLDRLLADLPVAVIAAIVINAVAHLFAGSEIAGYARVRWVDAAAAGICLATVLVVGPLVGLGVGIGVALVAFVADAGRTARTLEPGADGTVVVRLDRPLFWPNAQRWADAVLALADGPDAPTRIVLDLGGTTQLDVTSAEVVQELRHQLARRGVTLTVVCPHPEVVRVLDATAGPADDGPGPAAGAGRPSR